MEFGLCFAIAVAVVFVGCVIGALLSWAHQVDCRLDALERRRDAERLHDASIKAVRDPDYFASLSMTERSDD